MLKQPITFIIRHHNETGNLMRTLGSMLDNGEMHEDDTIVISDDAGVKESPLEILPHLQALAAKTPADMFVIAPLARSRTAPTIVIDLKDHAGPSLMRGGEMSAMLSLLSEVNGEENEFGPQAAAQRGSVLGESQWLCFLDAHMAFGPGWREFDLSSVIGAASVVAPPWRPINHETWDYNDTVGDVRYGATWAFQNQTERGVDVFNFKPNARRPDGIETKTSLNGVLETWDGFVPLAGFYLVPRELFERYNGFRGLPANHGMELILSLRGAMISGGRPWLHHGLKVGHVNQASRPKPHTYHRQSLFNAVSFIAITDTLDRARVWLETLPMNGLTSEVRALFQASIPMLEKHNKEFHASFHTLSAYCNLDAACSALGIEPPATSAPGAVIINAKEAMAKYPPGSEGMEMEGMPTPPDSAA